MGSSAETGATVGLDLGDQLVKTNLVDVVVDRLMEAVGNGELHPGDDLPSEGALGESLGVSRTVIREALRHLAAFGMVELRSGRKARVLALSSKPLGVYFEWAVRADPGVIVEIQQLRAAVEGAAAALAATRISAAEREELRDHLALMEDAQSDIARYAELDTRLHLRLTELSDNALLYDVIEAARGRVHFAIVAGLEKLSSMPGGIGDVHAEHVALVTAVIDADAKRARELVEAHVLGAADRIVAELQHASGPAVPAAPHR